MPPKQKQDGETAADREATAEAKRRRRRATPALLQADPPPDTAQIPTSLRKCDGADIVKRNANRKKKYLFVFPGALSLATSGGKIGSLTSLDTRNPVLNVQFPSGTLRLLGTLVFPKNAFISVKPTKRAVQVIDVFETMIVFSEWRWIGDPASNPGGIPAPLPDTLKAPKEDLWRSASIDAKPPAEGYDNIQLSSDGESAALADSDENAWASTTIDRTAPVRSNPRRKGRVVNYSQLENDEGNDVIDESSDGEATNTNRGVKRGTNAQQDMDDSVQIIEDEEEIKPARASRRKRRKVDYTGDSEEDVEVDGSSDRNEDGGGGAKYEGSGKNAASQNDARTLQFDDSVELVEPVKAEEEKTTRRGSRRTRRTIKYSQESGDDYMEEDDEEDKDFAVDADDEEPFKFD